MSVVTILGAGAGGCAAAVELALAGHQVRLWNRGAQTLVPHIAIRGVRASGVLGDLSVELAVVTTDLKRALEGADAAVVCLPALAHAALAADLAVLGVVPPLVLHPGHTLGAAHVASYFAASRRPPLAELSTLGYVARKQPDGVVTVSGRAGRLRGAAFGSDTAALEFACALWPATRVEPDVLATSLANVNLVLHPPAAILAAAWVEATGGDFGYYSEATTPSVASVMAALDDERLAVARAFGHELDPLIQEMLAIGTVDAVPAVADSAEALRGAVSTGEANAAIRAPSSLAHRYYREDFAYGVVPLLELARVAGVGTPVAGALLEIADVALHGAVRRDGLTLTRLGIRARTPDALRNVFTEGET